ncbi:putative Spidroin-1 (Dragline silk fibroin 1) [Burkholderia gladioli]|nr:putative Spidroin-1 (Dragline silk fibroin 1) [Burkholderia gladioli]
MSRCRNARIFVPSRMAVSGSDEAFMIGGAKAVPARHRKSSGMPKMSDLAPDAIVGFELLACGRDRLLGIGVRGADRTARQRSAGAGCLAKVGGARAGRMGGGGQRRHDGMSEENTVDRGRGQAGRFCAAARRAGSLRRRRRDGLTAVACASVFLFRSRQRQPAGREPTGIRGAPRLSLSQQGDRCGKPGVATVQMAQPEAGARQARGAK